MINTQYIDRLKIYTLSPGCLTHHSPAAGELHIARLAVQISLRAGGWGDLQAPDSPVNHRLTATVRWPVNERNSKRLTSHLAYQLQSESLRETLT